MTNAFTGKHSAGKIVLILFAFLILGELSGQTFSSAPSETTVTIEGNNFTGFQTYIEFPAEYVSRAFWKYSKGFAHLENNKSYYKVIIPPTEEAYQAMTLYGKPTKNGTTTLFSLSADLEEVIDEKVAYLQQLKLMLMEFKVDVYMNDYQGKINALSKEASKLSKSHQKSLKKGELFAEKSANTLSRLQSIEKQISEYRDQQVVLLSVLGTIRKNSK